MSEIVESDSVKFLMIVKVQTIEPKESLKHTLGTIPKKLARWSSDGNRSTLPMKLEMREAR